MRAWIEGFFRWPTFDVVCRGSWPSIISCGLIKRKQSITTLPLTYWVKSDNSAQDNWTLPPTLWTGSMTMATARWLSASKDCWVFISTPVCRMSSTLRKFNYYIPDIQQPKPGCEWYQPRFNYLPSTIWNNIPTTISGRPVCLSISSIFVWNTGSTASTWKLELDTNA